MNIIKKYDEIFQELKEDSNYLKNRSKINQDIIEQIRFVERNIANTLKKFDKKQQLMKKRKQYLQDSIHLHPKNYDNVIHIREQKTIVKEDIEKNNNFKSIPENHELSINITIFQFYPLINKQAIQQIKIPSFYIHMHHLNQHIKSDLLFYNNLDKLHTQHKHKGISNKSDQFEFIIKHSIKSHNYHILMKELIKDEFSLFLESKSKIIFGKTQFSIAQYLQLSKINKWHKIVLPIYYPVQQSESNDSIVGFYLQGMIKLQLQTLSIQKDKLTRYFTELQNKSNSKRKKKKNNKHSVLSISPHKNSKSPNKSLEKIQKMKSIIHNRNFLQIQILDKVKTKLEIKIQIDLDISLEPAIMKVQNIKQKSIHVFNEKGTWVLELFFVIKEGNNRGFIIFQLQKKCKYEIEIIPDFMFKVINQEEGKKMKEQLYTHNNVLLTLTPTTFLYPSEKIRLVRYPVTQQMQSGLFSLYFVKSTHSEIQLQTYPLDLVYVIKRKQQGFMVYYKLLKPPTSQNSYLTFSIHGKQSQMFQIHIIEFKIIEPSLKNAPLITLQVDKIGFYKIGMSGIAKQNSKSKITSLNPDIVRIVNGQNFILNSEIQFLQIQVIKDIITQTKVQLIFDDLERMTTVIIKLLLLSKQQKKQTKFSSEKFMVTFG